MLRRTLLQVMAMTAGHPMHKSPVETLRPGPLYFPKHEYETLRALCGLILPAEGAVGGALEANVPEFIDLLASENADYQRRLSGGLIWLDAYCQSKHEQPFIHCSAADQKAALDQIAFRDKGLAVGVQFFAFVRDLTLDGFFTSKIGIEYLQFNGNQPLTSFPGCPEPNL